MKLWSKRVVSVCATFQKQACRKQKKNHLCEKAETHSEVYYEVKLSIMKSN